MDAAHQQPVSWVGRNSCNLIATDRPNDQTRSGVVIILRLIPTFYSQRLNRAKRQAPAEGSGDYYDDYDGEGEDQ